MNTLSFPSSKLASVRHLHLLLFITFLTTGVLADAQSEPCDCSCAGYDELLGLIDRGTEQIHRVDQCGAACAIAWARCDDGETSASASHPDIELLGWLGGCWQSEGGETGSGEHWLPPAGDSMLGVGRTVREGTTVAFEFMQIRRLGDGNLAFIAQPAGREPTTFPLLSLDPGEAVFENRQHDFPTRVIYASHGPETLHARIEGTRNDREVTVPFPMTRISCGDGH